MLLTYKNVFITMHVHRLML